MARINKFEDQNEMLAERQNGFRKGISTIDVNLQVVETAKGEIQTRGLCAIVAVDICTAFNSVP